MVDLEKFIRAQEYKYEDALAEIKQGHKTSHWMWYIFPQIIGLGSSDTSIYYAIKNLEEAKEYLENPLLSQRLLEITKELLKLQESNPEKIFGPIDALKLKSSMTLFSYVSPENPLFKEVLEKYYEGEEDQKTIEICGRFEKRKRLY